MVSELWFSRRDERLWAAVVEDRRIVEIHPAWPQPGALHGAVYLARVQRVVPHLGAAFVQLAPGLEGYLEAPAGEVAQLGSGQALIVQVRREAHEGKRARVSTQPEFAGRSMSLRPGGFGVAVSRSIDDPDERRRLERWARAAGPGRLVLRTAAAGVTESELETERGELSRQAAAIEERARGTSPAALLCEAPSLIERLIRDYAGRGLRKIVVETEADEACSRAVAAGSVAIERHIGSTGLIHANGILETALAAAQPRVELDCGGSLTIETTRALWAVDVDSGPARVPALAVNREAARTIAREIRLRDLAGTILVDFLGMKDDERDLLEAEFRQALRHDRRYLRVTGWTGLGLCEMARRREGPSLLERLRSVGVR
jgi:Rne/Rng family ribonuclease